MSPAEIDEIHPLLAAYVEAGLLPPPPGKIARLLTERGLPDSEVNPTQAETIYLRAVAIALREQADTFESGFIDNDDHLRAVTSRSAREPIASPDPRERSMPPEVPVPKLTREQQVEVAAPASIPKVSLKASAAKVIAEKRQFKRWNNKTCSQAGQTYELFAKSLGHDDLTRVAQTDLSDFKDLLLGLPKLYGKSVKDRALTAAQLRAKGASLPPDHRGLGVDALNRHLNFLGQLFVALRAQGSVLDPAALRAKEDADPMDEVLPWSRQRRAALYAQPPFVGCADWKRRMKPGNTVFHDGLFWCPMVCDLHGLRREECAGLGVDDVVHDEDTGITAIDVRPNQFRHLKRTWTARRIPIHSELIRLGFLEYVQTIRALSYEALFPDLLPARPGAPIGEQLANAWAKVEAGAFPSGKPEKRAFRSFRHTFNKELKDAGGTNGTQKNTEKPPAAMVTGSTSASKSTRFRSSRC